MVSITSYAPARAASTSLTLLKGAQTNSNAARTNGPLSFSKTPVTTAKTAAETIRALVTASRPAVAAEGTALSASQPDQAESSNRATRVETAPTFSRGPVAQPAAQEAPSRPNLPLEASRPEFKAQPEFKVGNESPPILGEQPSLPNQSPPILGEQPSLPNQSPPILAANQSPPILGDQPDVGEESPPILGTEQSPPILAERAEIEAAEKAGRPEIQTRSDVPRTERGPTFARSYVEAAYKSTASGVAEKATAAASRPADLISSALGRFDLRA